MDFAQAVRSVLSKYATFSGRAQRSEYWYFTLFSILVTIAAEILDSILFGWSGGEPGTIGRILWLVLLLPTISVSVRRLHDGDRSGWWWWLWMIPVVGWIILLIWMIKKGTDGPNEFGLDPLDGYADTTFSNVTHKSSIPSVRRKD